MPDTGPFKMGIAMRIRCRFGLRTLLIAITAAGLLVGGTLLWYRTHEFGYLQERVPFDRLIKAGAMVEGDSTWLTRHWTVFNHVTGILCDKDTYVDAVLNEIPKLPWLRHVSAIIGLTLTPEQTERIERLKAAYPEIDFSHLR
jgi:hypothetical protein